MIEETEKKHIYKLKPSSGEALLNYNGRLGANELYMQIYELDEKIEKVNNQLEQDKDGEIYEGDCLSLCAYLKNNNQKVDFVYIDPPFASNVNYSKKIFFRNRNKKEVFLSKAEQEFDKKIKYDEIWSKEDYLNWLYIRLIAIREVIDENGSIMVHLNWNIGNYVKVLLDEVFGEENFRNEIIWGYRTGGASKKDFLARKHDSIYFYSKNQSFKINQLTERNYLGKSFMNSPIDEQGRYYSDTILRDILDGTIRIVESNGEITEYNVQPPLNQSKEFLDYSNQRSKDLLKILIRIATKENDIVADFFGGSGTTSIAAYELNRKFITCDIEKNSIQLMRDELKNKNAKFDVLQIKDKINLFRDPAEAKNILFKYCLGEQRTENSNYSAFWDGKVSFDKKMLCTKIISNKEILDKDYIEYFINQIKEEVEELKECLLVYVYKEHKLTQNDIDKKLKESNLDIKIYLVPIENLTGDLQNKILSQDSAYITLSKTKDKYKIKIENYFSPYINMKIKEENTKRIKNKKQEIEISSNGYELIELVSIDTKMEQYWESTIEDKSKKKEIIKGEYYIETDKFRIKIRNIAGDEIIISSEEVARINEN